MSPLSATEIRASFANASKREVADLTLPTWFGEVEWGDLDFLGWRDPKVGRRAYAVVLDNLGVVTGILLRQADASPRSRAQCSWCQDVTRPNDVVFYSAKKAGTAGRNGDTVGTLICQDFQCSTNVRRHPPLAYTGFDLDAARDDNMRALRVRMSSFVVALRS